MSSSFRKGILVGGQYRIDEEIGRGGMATVYHAWDEKNRRDVAVKVLSPDLTGALGGDLFSDEIRTTAGLAHPHILTLLDSGQAGGSPFFVTPLVRGESLRDRLKRLKVLSVDETLGIGSAVARALAHAHAFGVIHRDVKPANILLDGEGNPYLADFGIARALSATETLRTSAGEVLGTLEYMSPEQVNGEKEIDGTTDLYSLACVIYEMLTGNRPFEADDPRGLIAAILFKIPEPLRNAHPDVPAGVDELIHSALSKETAGRVQTAAEFAGRLEDLRVIARSHDSGVTLSAVEAREKAAIRDRHAARLELVGSRPEVHPSREEPPGTRRWTPYAVGAAVLVGVVAIGVAGEVWPRRAGGVLPDTTRYVVLPVGQDVALADAVPIRVLLEDALRRWEGITVVDGARAEAAPPTSSSTDLTLDWLRQVARETGAGRIVTARARPMGDSIRVEARLLDPDSSVESLETRVFMIRPDGSGSEEPVARAVEWLLFRTTSPNAGPLREHTSSVAAARQFLLGDAARTRWSLTEAARHLAEAAKHDPSFALARFWRAQVMSWQARPIQEWEVDARRALQAADALSPRERSLATALAAMADERYQEACSVYEQLRERDEADFAAQFGLGECRRRDPIVLPDAGSRTSWSFRASGHAAAAAYRRAFELLPSSFLGFGAESPEFIRRLFYTRRGIYRTGVSPGPGSMTFDGYGEWRGDSLAFLPVPREAAANFGLVLEGRAEALLQQRRALLAVANDLAREFPTSSGARHVLAVARELVGEASALDTYREARDLAEEPKFRAEIGIAEVVLQVRLSMPANQDGLRAAVALGESILTEAASGRLDAPRELAELAVLLGQPNRAARMSRASVDGSGLLGTIPMEVLRETAALLAFSAVGAPVDSIRTVEARAERLIDQSVPGSESRTVRRSVLEQPSFLAFPEHTLEFLDDLTLPQGREARAIATLAAGDAEEAVRLLGDPFSEFGWDVMLARANILNAAGRDSLGLELLRSHLGSLKEADPAEVRGVPRLGGLTRAVALRAELEAALGSREEAAEWARAAEILWSAGESEVFPVLERMAAIARSQEQN